MLSQQKSIISSDDDDYELPSLAERIKASLAIPKKNVSLHISSESEDEDSSFLKFSEMIQSTPCTQVQINENQLSDKKIEECNVLKSVEKINPQPLNIKLDFSLSDSEDEDLQFLSFSQKIQSVPHIEVSAPQVLGTFCESDSDDEVFSNLVERCSKMWTPRIEDKENYSLAIMSDEVMRMNEFRTPLPPKKKSLVLDSESDESFSNFIEVLKTPLSVKKKELHETVDSESDGSFSSFIQTLKTPMSVNRKISHKVTDSESDGSFSSFIERIRTPLSVNRNIQNKVTESDSDDSFLNKSRKQPFRTPKSHKKKLTDDVLPKITESKKCSSTLDVENTPHSKKTSMSTENEKEFGSLFESERISSTFLHKRESYTRMLYEFFNEKVFNSQLPVDMPLFYDGALKTTAGITCCSMKNGIYTCSIKLSSSLLNSFDRLKETLLHEMCHAAVWIINKQRHVRHGPLWQVWASRCKLILPFIKCPTRCHNYEISYRIYYQCPKCQWKKGSCKQLKKYHGALCKKCRSPIIMICN